MGKMFAFLKDPAGRRKMLIYSAIGLVVLLVVLFFIFRPFSSGRKYDPLTVIPDDAAIIFKINNVELLLGNDSAQRLPAQLYEFAAIHDFLEGLSAADTLFGTIDGQENLLRESTIYISLHFSARNPATALFILETDGNIGGMDDALLENENLNVSEKEFEGTDYLSIDDASFYAYRYGNLIVASKNNLLLHSSITTCDNGNSFTDNKNFQKSLEAASESADVNAFIHLPFIYRMLGGIFSSDAYGDLAFLQDFAGWGNIDISYSDAQLLFAGVFPNENGQKSFINVFKSASVVSGSFDKFLPANTSSAQAYSFNDFTTFQKSWEDYMNRKDVAFDASSEQYLFNESAGSEDLADLLISHFSNTLCVFACPGTQSVEPDVFCTVGINNAADLEEGMRKQMKNSSEKRHWDSTAFRDITIFSIPVQYGSYSLFGPFFNAIEKTHIAVCDSVLYIGNSVSSLKNMLNNVLSGRTLASAPHYKQLKSGLNSTWNTWSYLNVNNALYQLNIRWLGDSSTMTSVQNLSDKEHGMYMAITSSKEDQGILFSGSIVFGKAEGNVIAGWFTSLDARIESGPVILNAPALKKYWIIASDVYENIYLLDSQGRVEWKTSIEGKPNNDYSLVYANDENRCAVVFSAGDYLYMIGIDGKSKTPFPVKVSEGIATPVIITDYDKNHKYRIIFSDKDGEIRNYNLEGKNTPGWEKPKGDMQFEKNIIYRRLNGKDYIITLQSDNSVFIANRRGETLVEIMDVWFNKACNTFYADDEHNAFYASDLEGSIISITPDGIGEIIIPGSYSEDYVFAKLGDDFIIFDEGVMYVMNINGEVIERKEISESSMFAIRTFLMNGSYYIGYQNHDEDMGLIGAGSNTFINDDSHDFQYFDLIEDGGKVLLIKGYEKTVSAEVLKMDMEL